jgi:hypothetical protein
VGKPVRRKKEPLDEQEISLQMNAANREQLTMAGGVRYSFADIATEKDAKLEELVRRGIMPDMASIAGWEFKGRNISAFSALINIRRFIKGFRAIPPGSDPPRMLDGYNLWVRQDRGLEKSWRQINKMGKTWRHGFFKVHPVDPDSPDNKHPNALLIDYSLAKNPFYRPDNALRDYFVQVYPDNPDLYIGKVTAALGDQRIFAGYFVLERLQQPEDI